MSVHNEMLMCGLDAVGIVGEGIVEIHIPEHHSCDGRGAVKLATFVMPDCTLIYVYANGKPESRYVQDRDGKWEMRCMRRCA